jgi:3-oxoacyl-[acyl-carrier protein] reductase
MSNGAQEQAADIRTGQGERTLADKVAIVTGAARGIGRAYAHRLARCGAAVAVVDADLQSYRQFAGEEALMTAESTDAEIRAAGGDSVGIETDVTDAAAMQRLVEAVCERWGSIDVAVCNAGGGSGKITDNAPTELDLDALDLVLRRNLYGTIHTCTAVAPMMKKQRSGSIITVSSTEGVQSLAGGTYAHYCIAKAGIVMYTRCLAQELGPFNVRANAVAPGFIATGRILPMIDDLGGSEAVSEIALRRVGTPEECAGVIEFLASDLSSYVTGHVIPIEGGWIRGGI